MLNNLIILYKKILLCKGILTEYIQNNMTNEYIIDLYTKIFINHKDKQKIYTLIIKYIQNMYNRIKQSFNDFYLHF